MSDLVNLVVDLDARFDSDAAARERVARGGLRLEVSDGASDRVLAWIDDRFGGAWSGEAARAHNVVAWRADAPVGFASSDAQGLRYAWLRGVAREPGVGLFGPFGVEESERGGALGPALLETALCALRARGYDRALIGAANDGLVPYYERCTGARVVERCDPRAFTPARVRTVALASGAGTNFQAVIDRIAKGLPLELCALIGNRPQAFALERARLAGVRAVLLPWERAAQSRAEYDVALLEAVRRFEPELVLLLGWMHLLAPSFVDAFPALLNVHPAFLPLDPDADEVGMPDGSVIPAYRGAHAVTDALAARSQWIGATVHAVTAQTDRGAVLMRKPLRVAAGEDESAVLARLHPIEHRLVEGGIRRWLYERNV